MNPTKDIAKNFISKHYSEFLTEFDDIWAMLEKMSRKNKSLSGSSKQLLEGFSFGAEADPEYNEMMSVASIFFLIYQQTISTSDIGKDGFLNKMKQVCTLHKISSGLRKKMEETVNIMYSSTKESGRADYEYVVWYKDSEPKGKLIDRKKKEKIVKDKKRYDLLILKEDTITHFYLNGERGKPPSGKLPYRILTYILKHKGTGGTAWNIAKRLWDVKEAELFKDLKEMAKAVKLQPKINKAKMEALDDNLKNHVENFSSNVRKNVSILNNSFLQKLGTKLSANKMDEYELKKTPDYCLIEKVTD